MQISDVRNVIAAAAAAVVLPTGAGALTSTGYTPDSISEPHFFCAEVTVDFDKTMGRGQDELEITARCLVGRQDDRSAQEVLDLLLSGSGAASLKAAIEAVRRTPTLLAVADDLHVKRVQGYRWYEHQNTTYIGAELIIRVIGDGSTT
jgi:hypothetical protein